MHRVSRFFFSLEHFVEGEAEAQTEVDSRVLGVLAFIGIDDAACEDKLDIFDRHHLSQIMYGERYSVA